MAEYRERSREIISQRVDNVVVDIDYNLFFSDQHSQNRARLTTESIWRKITHGQAVQAEYSNPLGYKAVPDYEVPATWAIGSALEHLPGNFAPQGRTLRERGSREHPAVVRKSELVITPIRQNGKRLVTERTSDGNTHSLVISWMSEKIADGYIEAERKYIKSKSN